MNVIEPVGIHVIGMFNGEVCAGDKVAWFLLNDCPYDLKETNFAGGGWGGGPGFELEGD